MKLYNLLVSSFVLGALLLLSDSLTGAPSSIYGHYCCAYDGSTAGVIVRSRIKERAKGAVYDVLYAYTVNGMEYSSDKVRFSANYRNVAYSTVKKFPVGKEITVYFYKKDPRYAVLEIGSPGMWIWGQVVSALIIGCFLIYMLIGRKNEDY